MVPKNFLTPILRLGVGDSIASAHWRQRRTSGAKAGEHACIILVDGQLPHIGRHKLEVLVVPARYVVAVRQGNSSDINNLSALALPLPYLVL